MIFRLTTLVLNDRPGEYVRFYDRHVVIGKGESTIDPLDKNGQNCGQKKIVCFVFKKSVHQPMHPYDMVVYTSMVKIQMVSIVNQTLGRL